MNQHPLLITLGLDTKSFDRLDDLRNRYFPPERNFIPAHISLFHHLPPEESATIDETLAGLVASSASFPVRFTDLFRLGGGFAVRVKSEGLASLHKGLATSFRPWLTPQDRQPFKPHITIMNKADRDTAVRAFAEMQATWSPWEGLGESVRLWRYLGGPWEAVARYPLGAE